MKINKAKIMVTTLAIAAVAATVGSISGTVAWFQYSTRVTAAYSGATAHVSENLQIRLYRAASGTDTGYDSGWKQDLRLADVQAYIANVRGSADYDLRPITSGDALDAEGKIADTFYKNPKYQYGATYTTTNNAWEAADDKDYVELPIELRVLDVNGEGDDFLNKDIFLTDLTIAQPTADASSHGDITPALRVSFDATNDATFSKAGGSIDTHGTLDLNGDGRLDKEEGYEDFATLDNFVYGGDTATETTSEIVKATDANGMLADDTDPLNIVGKKLGTTDGANGLAVKVRIYLEGWQPLETKVKAVETGYANLEAMQAAVTATTFAPEAGAYYKTADNKVYSYGTSFTEVTEGKDEVAVWNDTEFVGAEFQVGLRFSAEAHSDHA